MSEIALTFFISAAAGLVFLFGPMGAVLAVKARRPDWLLRYAVRINWYTSLAGALSLGYLIASIRHEAFDGLTCAAVAVVVLGAAVKSGLSDAFDRRKPIGE